jgi:hypothetical protein
MTTDSIERAGRLWARSNALTVEVNKLSTRVNETIVVGRIFATMEAVSAEFLKEPQSHQKKPITLKDGSFASGLSEGLSFVLQTSDARNGFLCGS